MLKAKVFSTSNCSWCTKAKELLVSKGIEVQMISLDDQNSRALFRRDMSKAGHGIIKTVPQIFIDDYYVGGYEDLVAFLGC